MSNATRKAASPQNFMQTSYKIRRASSADITEICAVSLSATKKFSGIPALADLGRDEEEPATVRKWLSLGRIYLAEVEEGQALGFIAAYPMDDIVYIAEISTHGSSQGRGVGSALLNTVFQWARDRAAHDGVSMARVSLTTYADVIWNGPWYRKRGFKEVDAASIGPRHVEKMTKDKQERNMVRPGYRRCCMLWEAEASQQ
ncbi:hypothetical protein LTR37_015176 [Vermiconidia calcicola]|uniref:Uncharacterized protein n=1 Tax=Vermiconidia calcicola TaxID=1690605 RepID=A0ACC3MR78_9PEZI|nr:hypothetical protein LTR37_015176 [Vermiconidia calcicola]